MQSIYIYGASGHGLVVADIATSCGYDNIIFVDDGDNKYLSFDEIKDNSSTPLAFGIGLNRVREMLFDRVSKYGFNIITLIHPTATISPNSTIGIGTVVMPKVVVNTHAVVGKGAILNTASIIEHENSIEDFSHISPTVGLAGNVTVGKNTHIGIGSSVIQGITIGKNCIIGAGSVVVKDIPNSSLAYGNPCKVIRKIDE
jgi:UDP-N-acetylbacillosamine N-acetyltransferase